VESHGKAAERLVSDRVRAALSADAFGLYPNAEWLGSMRDGGPPRDGETDLVIVHADYGVLVLEVKSGVPSRDHAGRWWIGGRELDRDPFTQAKQSKHQLVRKLTDMAGWPPRTEPRAGHPRRLFRDEVAGAVEQEEPRRRTDPVVGYQGGPCLPAGPAVDADRDDVA
jgi:hypothetical protein